MSLISGEVVEVVEVVVEELWSLSLLQDWNVMVSYYLMVVWAGEEEQEVWPLSLLQDWGVTIHLIAGEKV